MKKPSLSEPERFDSLRLGRSEQVGTANYRRLIDRFGSAGEALANIRKSAQPLGKAKLQGR